jgi:hypothetical protein
MPIVSARIGDSTAAVRFDGPLRDNADAAVPLFLLTAMQRGEDLTISNPVSVRLLDALPRIQEIVDTWWPPYERVAVRAEPRGDTPARAEGVACFFTGGVDSFYTALDRLDDIDFLVYVHGFDVRLSETSLRDRVADGVRGAAEALGKPLIEVESDLRDVLEPNWMCQHGSALAAVGHLLDVGTVLIPASHTWDDLRPWGSHAVLDPLWSGDRTRFVYHGADTNRPQKTMAIAHHPGVLRHLRVCFDNPGGTYNCGTCEKCIRTSVALHLAGTLEQCETLPPLSHKAVRRLRANTMDLPGIKVNLACANRAGDVKLARELDWALRRNQVRITAGNVTKSVSRRLGRP